MNNTTIQNMKTRITELNAALLNTGNIVKLQDEQRKAKTAIYELTKQIDDLTAVETFDAAVITPEITTLKALRTTAEGKLALIDDALSAALAAHQSTNEEFSRLKAAVETVTSTTVDLQVLVDDIKTPPFEN